MTRQMDRQEKLKGKGLDGARIQHGPYSDRVYLMDMGSADPPRLAEYLRNLARRNGYGKIFAKVPEKAAAPFLSAGYELEAKAPGFFNGRETALFLGAYPKEDRRRETDPAELDAIRDLALKKGASDGGKAGNESSGVSDASSIRICAEADIPAMAALYARVFPSYPFPIHDPDYLLETMRSHVRYFGIPSKESESADFLALSSAEMDREHENVEMTDFAVRPDQEGKGHAGRLLAVMDRKMRIAGIKTAYTIARAVSAGMNIVFARAGYQYGGRLINNTQISGSIESMNVWHRGLS